MQFEFSIPTRIIFGAGKLNSIGDIAFEFGKKAFIVSGCPKPIINQLIERLDMQKISCLTTTIDDEPTIDEIRTQVNIARQFSPDVVIGIGGGSALDSAKATATFLSNPGEVIDYLEVIGVNKPILNPSVPVIAIPTTSGTGAEVTKNAVITVPQHKIKVSLRSTFLYPTIALIDPCLALSMPHTVTAFTGLDALTQLIEPYTCKEPNPMVDILCREGIQRVSQSLYQAFDDGNNILARKDMSIASLFSGIVLSNAKLGAVHGLAGPLGGEIPASHGAICARLLPYVMEENLVAIKGRIPDHPVLERYTMIGKLLCNRSDASAEDGIEWIRKFCQHAEVPSLAIYGLADQNINKIVENAKIASSMKGNPITLSDMELRNILKKSL